MSIIRDFIEYYRMPAEIKIRLMDFEVKHTLLNGREERCYYALNGSNQYRMFVDMFTHDSVRYRRMQVVYDINFNIVYMTNQYDFGKKMRTDTFFYGSGVTAGAVIRMDSVETDINETWAPLTASTGWPNYNFGATTGVSSVAAGTNVTVNNTDPKNPVVSVAGNIVTSIGAGTNITIDNTNPKIPVISAAGSTVVDPKAYSISKTSIVNTIAYTTWTDYLTLSNISIQYGQVVHIFSRLELGATMDGDLNQVSAGDVLARITLNGVVMDYTGTNGHIDYTQTNTIICNSYYRWTGTSNPVSVKMQVYNVGGQEYYTNSGHVAGANTGYSSTLTISIV